MRPFLSFKELFFNGGSPRYEVELIREQERRLVGPDHPAAGTHQQDAPQEEPRAGPAPRDVIAENLSSEEEEDQPPRRRRRLADLIRENNELYNQFMTRTVPRILEEFGIDMGI
ncbi:hypothetical protein ACF0H5_015927 [Mactra antiquata]